MWNNANETKHGERLVMQSKYSVGEFVMNTKKITNSYYISDVLLDKFKLCKINRIEFVKDGFEYTMSDVHFTDEFGSEYAIGCDFWKAKEEDIIKPEEYVHQKEMELEEAKEIYNKYRQI